jgi:uncharacterized protein YceH (UPF0502 family)
MITLEPVECRVLGVLVEKAHTTPKQYPLTLNALVTGANQKNNRAPILSVTEDDVLGAIDGMRSKGLVREVMMSGSRVQKFRHVAREELEVSTSELVILAELLLRGPQTIGELRGRASRMHPIESLEVAQNVVDHLMQRTPPFVRSLAPAPGSRAARFGQLLCPDLHPEAPAGGSVTSAAGPAAVVAAAGPATDGLAARVERLEEEVRTLQDSVQTVMAALRSAESGSGSEA